MQFKRLMEASHWANEWSNGRKVKVSCGKVVQK